MPVEKKTDELVVYYCSACAHRCAEHKSTGPTSTDYHQQYDQDAFVKSLEKTRRRQANRLIDTMTKLKIKPDNLLDFGAGRGWFVKETLKRGGTSVAGTDTSDLSIQTLKSLGAETAATRFAGEKIHLDITPLSFQPKILSLLDVIEHFPPDKLEGHVRGLIKALPEVKWVVIKVPVAEGIMFRIARALTAFGWNGPYHQFFQVGTFPPHFHYFSKQSLGLFLTKVGITPRKYVDDADIDDVLGRMKGAEAFRWASGLVTFFFVAVGKLSGQDSRTVIGEISR